MSHKDCDWGEKKTHLANIFSHFLNFKDMELI